MIRRLEGTIQLVAPGELADWLVAAIFVSSRCGTMRVVIRVLTIVVNAVVLEKIINLRREEKKEVPCK